jgi:hypothetical protein
MNPHETYLAQAELAWNTRGAFGWDMNGDGQTTISDVWLVIKWLFYAPGDWLLLVFMRNFPGGALFFEVTPQSIYGFGSGVLSVLAWMSLWGIFKVWALAGRMP